MVWPSRKKILEISLLIAWLGIQILFFLPALKPSHFVFKTQAGNFLIIQTYSEAVMVGGFSDRRHRLVSMDLIPFRFLMQTDVKLITVHW